MNTATVAHLHYQSRLAEIGVKGRESLGWSDGTTVKALALAFHTVP